MRNIGKVLDLILKSAPTTSWFQREDGAFDVDVSTLPTPLTIKLVALVELDAQGKWPHPLASYDNVGKEVKQPQPQDGALASKRPKRQGDRSKTCTSCLTHK